MLSRLGEEGIVRMLKDIVPSKFVGLDTAFFPAGKNRGIAITTDMLQERTDFPKGFPKKFMGWKAVAACLSDLATTSAKPLAFLLSMACPDLRANDFGEIVKGAVSACKKFDCEYCRGDLNRDESGITLCGTAVGLAKHHTSRRGARAGDVLAVTNISNFGRAMAGLLSVQESRFKVQKRTKYAFLKPIPRIVEGLALSGFMNSCIDSSDGLSASLVQLCGESGVGALIDEEKLKKHRDVIRAAEKVGVDPAAFQMCGGEEFELVLTMSKKSWEARDWKSIAGLDVIGRLTKKANGVKLKRADGLLEKISWTGWKKF